MDDRTFRLAAGALAASVFVMILDAVLGSFEVPREFFGVPSGVLIFLGTRSAIKRNGNSKEA